MIMFNMFSVVIFLFFVGFVIIEMVITYIEEIKINKLRSELDEIKKELQKHDKPK